MGTFSLLWVGEDYGRAANWLFNRKPTLSMSSVSWLKRAGTPYVLAFIVALGLAALTYQFNSTIANFVIGAGLIALAYGIILKAMNGAKDFSNDSSP